MRRRFVYIWVLLVLSVVMVWWQWPSMEVEVVMCDVGQGDGMIVTQGFSQMLIDTGRANGEIVNCLGQVLPFWDRRIEMVVVTHADSDHAGGLRKVDGLYQIQKLVTSELSLNDIKKQVFDATRVEVGLAGKRWQWGQVGIEIVWPPRLETLSRKIAKSSNDSGLVMRLEFEGGDSMWLAADAGSEVEKILMEMGSVKPTTVLKVSHHGSRNATTEPFLGILQPRIFLISVGQNSYGHPANEVLGRIRMMNGQTKRTDELGQIRWAPDK